MIPLVVISEVVSGYSSTTQASHPAFQGYYAGLKPNVPMDKRDLLEPQVRL
jgi:hypothetical protein